MWHLLVPLRSLSAIIINVPLLLFAWFQITSPRFKHDGTCVQGNILLQAKFVVMIEKVCVVLFTEFIDVDACFAVEDSLMSGSCRKYCFPL